MLTASNETTREEMQLLAVADEKKRVPAESDEETFDNFSSPPMSLSPLVGMLMQRMAEERPPMLEANNKIHRQRSEPYPDRPKTPSPPATPMTDEESGALSPLVGSLLGKSFSPEVITEEDEPEPKKEDPVAAATVAAAEASVPEEPPVKVTPRQKSEELSPTALVRDTSKVYQSLTLPGYDWLNGMPKKKCSW